MKYPKFVPIVLCSIILALAGTSQLTAAPTEVEELFGPGQASGDTGFDSDWFGLIEESALPWIKHQDLGWLYLGGDGWFYQPELGWTWVSTASKGHLYRNDTKSWQYSLAAAAEGWFYDFTMRDFWSADYIPAALTVQVFDRFWQADAKVREVIPTVPSVTDYPIYTASNGTWTYRSSSDWTAGFWPGILWQLYDFTGADYYEEQARAWNAGMENQKTNTGTHDIGFMMYCSFGQGFRLTGDEDYRDILVQSADSLNTRYSHIVGGMRSWSWGKWNDGNNFTIIADNMMNLELEFWASKQPTGDTAWGDNALNHALTTYREHVREDGGSFHCIIFDENTGGVLDQTTHQGWRDNSTWGRGQAWLIHGFTTTYRETSNETILEAAQRTAEFFLDNIPANKIPYWDFDINPLAQPRDTSAAAIAASGMMELASLTDDPDKKALYWGGALDILESLLSDNYFNDETQALIDHGTYNKPAGNFDTGLVWGDYYLLEAMLRYLRIMGRH